MRWWAIGAALACAGCGGGMTNEQQAALVEKALAHAEAAAQNAAEIAEKAEKAAMPNHDDWVGQWVGVEGLTLTIEKDPAEPGHYRLTNRWSLDEDAIGKFDGVATARGIAFTRPDGAKELVATDGEATGLKWLAGKKDCLTVTPGEGYCRD